MPTDVDNKNAVDIRQQLLRTARAAARGEGQPDWPSPRHPGKLCPGRPAPGKTGLKEILREKLGIEGDFVPKPHPG